MIESLTGIPSYIIACSCHIAVDAALLVFDLLDDRPGNCALQRRGVAPWYTWKENLFWCGVKVLISNFTRWLFDEIAVFLQRFFKFHPLDKFSGSVCNVFSV